MFFVRIAAWNSRKIEIPEFVVGGHVSRDAGYKDEVEWLWALWSAHNTYAYVRLWYAFLQRVDSLQSHLYSVAILLAGATAGGQAVGFVFVPLLVAACYAYQAHLHRSAKTLLDRIKQGRKRVRTSQLQRLPSRSVSTRFG